MRALVVDDDPSVREALRRALSRREYEVRLAADGVEALASHRADPADVIVLDVSMPGLSGIDTCRVLRGEGDHTPVLMLTARDAVPDRVAGLEAGADDYLVKPFALDELVARLRALLRRTTPASAPTNLGFADVSLDRRTYEVRRGTRVVELTRTEFLLLELFLENPCVVLTRSTIFERVWGYDFGGSSNSLDVYVGYLRRKLEAAGEPRLVQTIRGVGYVLRES